MSSIAKTLGLVVFSALLSVSGTVAVMNYAPSLVPLRPALPEIVYASSQATAQTTIDAGYYSSNRLTDWHDVDGLTVSVRVYEESSLTIIVTGRFSHLTNEDMDSAVVYWRVLVDGEPALPEEVAVAIYDGSSSRGLTHAFHLGGVPKGLHEVRVQWRNQGIVPGALYERVVEVFGLPGG
jgi:hypothetical protein